MKTIYKSLAAAVVLVSMTGCNDLDPKLEGSMTTGEEKKDLTDKYPEKLSASLVGIAASATQYASIWPEEENVQTDFGLPSLMLGLDNRGMDMYSVTNGYNWYRNQNAMSDALSTSDFAEMAWSYPYKIIFAANALLSITGEESENPETQFYIAQALAERANAYMILAQIFQFTYIGNEKLPCVPIVTEKNSEEIALEGGSPRATVAQVYEQIKNDIDESIKLLASCGIQPANVVASKPKRLVSLATAYGIRARMNLIMGNWTEAASDAQNAISNFSGAPASIQEVSVPSFWSIDQSCWMWGFAVNETDRPVTTGICNWPSFMGAFCYGYATLTPAQRYISKTLYDQIPDTDVRKNWFMDGNGECHMDGDWKDFADDYLDAYVTTKFAPYQNEIGTSTNANDLLRMRIEEMYLIKAEAEAMGSGVAAGKATLENFVKTYRDPSFTVNATTVEEFRDIVWLQRRVELWGEGMSYFDIMRLKKPVDRRGGGWPDVWVYNVPAESDVLRIPIPDSEIQANKYISTGDNNPSSSQPLVVVE